MPSSESLTTLVSGGSNGSAARVPTLHLTAIDPGDQPVLCAVKQDNSRPDRSPVTTGYLYYAGEAFSYSRGVPDRPEPAFDWNAGIAALGKDPSWYLPTIAPDGTVIFIWRGNFITERGGSADDARQNPIVYPAGDYANPVVVNIASGDKPTAPLNNAGLDWDTTNGILAFAEYTRPVHAQAHIWRVTAPYTDPDNWVRAHSEDVDEDDSTSGAVKHLHTANYDPFSGCWLASSGDYGQQTKVYLSVDQAATWTVVAQGPVGDDQPYRLLNFAFTEDFIWWGTDNTEATPNRLFRIARTNGVPDFSTIEEVATLKSAQAVYATVLLRDGLLFLPRIDDVNWKQELEIEHWSFLRERLSRLAVITGLGDPLRPFGFRTEAQSLYPNVRDDRVVAGFDFYVNRMAVLGNTLADPIRTLSLEVRA